MPLRLILVRHAKSSWKEAALADHERPLNRRGRRSATAIGRWLADEGYLPERVLSSDSARTRETWARIAAELPLAPRAEWSSRLYHASSETILEAVREAGTASPLLLLGHNPGLALAARAFVAAASEHPAYDRYPTGATAVLEFDVARWSETGWRTADVRTFVVPRELLGT